MPHFILLLNDNNIYDYSLDPQKSPIINYDMYIPSAGSFGTALYFEQGMKIIFKARPKELPYQWYIGNDTYTTLSQMAKENPRMSWYSLTVSSQRYAKIFQYGGVYQFLLI